MKRRAVDRDKIAEKAARSERQRDNQLRNEATAKIDWNGGGHVYNWRSFIGPETRGIWHTLSDDQKVALAKDALSYAMAADEAAWEAEENA